MGILDVVTCKLSGRNPVKRIIGIILVISALSLPLAAEPGMPPGRWWRHAEVAERLALTGDQQVRLDEVFRNNAKDLVDLKGEMEKRSIDLRATLEQPQLNRTEVQKAATRVSEARGKLFEREVMMLVEMRSVLNDQQWALLRDRLEGRGDQRSQRQRLEGRGAQRPQRPGTQRRPGRRPR